jgi:formylglycine-generating enzyme required for sulfatase activity
VNRSPDRRDHPQNGLTWEQARAYCAWTGARLPSEAEWEYAAKGPVHRVYPWGDTPAPTCANETAVFDEAGTVAGYGCGTGGTWPVGSKAAGAAWSGALDLGGNLWEWVEDCWHTDYTGAPGDGAAWTEGCTLSARVIRGGAFHNGAHALRSAYRNGPTPSARNASHGARCLRPLP